ncbi:MAG: adenylate/guanylate cyclase domain-containing protein [Nannocystaceae bacterium]
MAERSTQRPLLALAGLTALLTVLCAIQRLGGGLTPMEGAERQSLDLRFRLRGPEAPGDDVVIVALDDATNARHPEILERRASQAELLRAIAAADPAAIGVDAIYLDPERPLSAGLTRDLEDYLSQGTVSNAPADLLLRRVGDEIRGDTDLEGAIAAAGNVVLGMSLGSRGEALPDDPSLDKGRYGQSVRGPTPPSPATAGLVSLPRFNAVAAGLGLITVNEDQDQTVRELIFARAYEDAVYAPLVVPLLAIRDGVARGALAYVGDGPRVQLGGRSVALGPGDRMILNFRGPAGTFPTVSAADVVDRKTPASALAGKIVLVGITYLGHDRTRAPFGPNFPAVELHATALDNILLDDPIARAPALVDVVVNLLVGLLCALLFLGRFAASPALRVAGLAGLAAAVVLVGHLAFVGEHLWIGVVWPLVTVGLCGVVGLALAYAGEAAQRRWLRKSFAHYLGAETLAKLLDDPGALALGGARRPVSILFSDIRDFTSISEHLSPERLVDFLSLYLTPMSQAVLARGGYLDKYIGDAVMAVFGAPVAQADHGERALATVIAMHRALDQLRPILRERGFERSELLHLEIGVGVNTGDVVVGNMGSAERFDYTAVGDPVNLASRLEGLTKVYGVRSLCGEATRAAAPASYRFREVDRVRVKGKAAPVAIFELLGGPEGQIVDYEGLEGFAAALAAYRAGDLAGARAGFTAFAALNPSDHVAALYLRRLDELGEVLPPGWDGVTTFHSK